MTADQAAQMLVRMMEDTEVPFGVRAKIAQDLLDRAGLASTQGDQDRASRGRRQSCGSSSGPPRRPERAGCPRRSQI